MKTNLWIWAKRICPMFAIAGAGLMIGCDKPLDEPIENDNPYSEPIDPVKVLSFGRHIGIDSINYANVTQYANDPRITKIIYFLDSNDNNNNYMGYDGNNISVLRGFLQEKLNITPKATGAGTFIFRPNKATVDDSLWFVKNGWQIKSWQIKTR